MDEEAARGEDRPDEGGRCETPHISVSVRLRPLTGIEVLADEGLSVVLQTDSKLTLRSGSGDVPFSFDHVLGPEATQEQVFELFGEPQLERLVKGHNGTILAYGQTGSGKTHTMVSHRGLVPRICDALFRRLARPREDSAARRFLVQCSVLEIRNEEIHDLLAPSGLSPKRGGLELKEQKGTGVYVDGLAAMEAGDAQSLGRLLEEGTANRKRAAIGAHRSSRSHCIFTIVLHQRHPENSSDAVVNTLHLVDLAGSDRLKGGEAEEKRATEGVSINKSLSALGNVITALNSVAAGRGRRNVVVPYRDSKLTRLLQDSFVGGALCTIIATVNPCVAAVDETLATLNFAKRARSIRLAKSKSEDVLRSRRPKREGEPARRHEKRATGVDEKKAERGPEPEDDRKARIEELDALMRQTFGDRKQLTRQCKEERRRAKEETERAAAHLRNKQGRQLQLLRQHGDLQLSLKSIIAGGSGFCAALPGCIGSLCKVSRQLRSQLRAARIYRENVGAELSTLWGCCANDAAIALALLAQARANFDALARELNALEPLEVEFLQWSGLAAPAVAAALHEARQREADGAGDPGSGDESSQVARGLPDLLALLQEQLAHHCTEEVEHLQAEAKVLSLGEDLRQLARCLAQGKGAPHVERAKLIEDLRATKADEGKARAAEGERATTERLPVLLGISNSEVADDRLSASSNAAAARCARLLQAREYGGWCPSRDSTYEYLEVDLRGLCVVTGLSLQGRVPCTGRWRQTYELLEQALGTDEALLQVVQPRNFVRPPVRLVHEVSIALLRRNANRPDPSAGLGDWDIPGASQDFADLSREQRTDFFRELIRKIGEACQGSAEGAGAEGIALRVTPQDILTGRNCRETNRMLQVLSYLCLGSPRGVGAAGGLVEVAPQWTETWRLEYLAERRSWKWFGALGGGGGAATRALTFEGNSDADSVRFVRLPEWLVTSKLRIHPVTWHRHAALRCEVHVLSEAAASSARKGGENSLAPQLASEIPKMHVDLATRSVMELQRSFEERQQDHRQENSVLECWAADASKRAEYFESRAVTAETMLLKERAEHERLNSVLGQLEAETLARCASKSGAEKDALQRTRRECSELQDMIGDFTQQLDALASARDASKRSAQELLERLDARDQQIAEVTKANADLVRKLKEKRRKRSGSMNEMLRQLTSSFDELQRVHGATLQRCETLEEELRRQASGKDTLAKKTDRLEASQSSLKEKLEQSRTKRLNLTETYCKAKGRAALVAERVVPPPLEEAPDDMQQGAIAAMAKSLTLGRQPGVPLETWMRPSVHWQRLGLGGSQSCSLGMSILERLMPALSLELPVPWDVHASEDGFYYVHAGFEPAVTSWEHPLSDLHSDLVAAFRRAARSTGQLRAIDVRRELGKIIHQIIEQGGIPGFGTWEAVTCFLPSIFKDVYSHKTRVVYQNCKTGQRRSDDPRVAAASQLGLSFIALRIAWNTPAGVADSDVDAFPFSDDEAWFLAEQMAMAVWHKPERGLHREPQKESSIISPARSALDAISSPLALAPPLRESAGAE